MSYTEQTWHDEPVEDTPLSAARLTHMENGIGDAHEELAALATVASSGSYDDLADTPAIPDALTDLDTTVTGTQLNALKTKVDGIASGAEVNVSPDWDAVSGDAAILNKPTLGTAAATDSDDYATAAQGALADSAVQPADLADVATSGSYDDLTDTPSIPDVSGKADKSTTISAGTGLTGGGDLSANRTLTVSYGTSGTTACVGNDSRLSDTRTPSDSSVTNAKVSSSAAIALSKLATGYVQGSSNGTATTLTVWIGTTAQYNAIGSKDSSTIYLYT